MIQNKEIDKIIEEIYQEILIFRRNIHKYPELSN